MACSVWWGLAGKAGDAARWLATRQNTQGVVLGKPKGTIQASMYDKDREKIQELLLLGVPQTRIVKTHLGYGTTKSLSYYIRTRKLRKKVQKP